MNSIQTVVEGFKSFEPLPRPPASESGIIYFYSFLYKDIPFLGLLLFLVDFLYIPGIDPKFISLRCAPKKMSSALSVTIKSFSLSRFCLRANCVYTGLRLTWKI